MAWQGRRAGRGQAVALHSDESGLVAVEDGARTIYVPHPRLAADFRTGVDKRLDAVAEKYLGNTGYEPREGDVIVDIGAGLGEFALWSAAAGAHVIAFEPDPLAFECLQKNTSSLSNVEIHQFALWKERANLRLHGSSDTRESSLIEDGKSNSRNSDVAAWPLDQVQFLTRLPVIDLMKIDGEGVEPEIIVGGTRTLRRVRIVAIDIGATDRRPNLKARVTSALTGENFRIVDHGRSDTILALNVAMVGPTNNRVLVRRGS
jgi:FkbM family methyltransferase